jgi:adenosylcobinamide-GDP ribazoletransferase
VVNEFITALQFLTRLRLVREPDCDMAAFGRSVRFFSLVGCVAGILLAIAALLTAGWLPGTVRSTLLVFLAVLITGGLHCDGLMDTADGVMSGRSRERVLEIMKDSRVGAFGVIAIIFLLLGKWSLIHDMPESLLVYALVSMMAIGRFAMTAVIVFFPYARPEGMGKAFAEHAGKSSFFVAALTLAGMVLVFYFVGGVFVACVAVGASLAALLFALWAGSRLTRFLGGLTGDTYGAVTELSEMLVLAVFLMAAYVK